MGKLTSKPSLPGENWREVPGYPEYEVSDHGRVWSRPRIIHFSQRHADGIVRRVSSSIGGKLLALTPSGGDKDQYFQVDLSRRGEGKKSRRVVTVQTLVLLAFVGPPPDRKTLALHRDDNGKNNRLDNLYWGSQKENMSDMRRNRMSKGSTPHYLTKLTEEHVRDIRTASEKGEPQRAIAARYGISQTTAGHIIRRKTWEHVT